MAERYEFWQRTYVGSRSYIMPWIACFFFLVRNRLRGRVDFLCCFEPQGFTVIFVIFYLTIFLGQLFMLLMHVSKLVVVGRGTAQHTSSHRTCIIDSYCLGDMTLGLHDMGDLPHRRRRRCHRIV
ncbi:hypothetical protein CCUS01_04181 [Colletotrichum cuscutae]|uniref:Uncharacterized protein n=1 Tax=Colletotrichum cuscutae TaxID=1209917 RepID=A0AAI9Y7R6_9PEZI|nr:hypothetical protein CCUS01_04181 [Colletotrichum cuscutae]